MLTAPVSGTVHPTLYVQSLSRSGAWLKTPDAGSGKNSGSSAGFSLAAFCTTECIYSHSATPGALSRAKGQALQRERDKLPMLCSEWKELITWPQEENGGPVAFTKDGKSVYVQSSLGYDTTRLLQVWRSPLSLYLI